MQAPRPYYKVIYNGVNITEDISKSLLSLDYVDNAAGNADELSITLEDVDARWQNDWYPSKGAKLYAEIGHTGGTILPCGTFTIDEISFDGPPDIVTIKAIAAVVTKSLRTKKSYAHDNKSLRQIVQTIADAQGLTIQGEIPDVKLQYVMQNEQTDLAFLGRLSDDFGCTFNIRDNVLTFTNTEKLEAGRPALVVKKSDTISYSFNDKTSAVYAGAEVTYHKQTSNQVVTGSASDDSFNGSDVKNLRVTAETEQQAELKARSALNRANSKQKTGTLSMIGNVYALAGNSMTVQDFGRFSGNYHIESSTHNITKPDGYKTSLAIKVWAAAAKIKSSTKPFTPASSGDSFN